MITTPAVYLLPDGPHGEPYIVRARFSDRIDVSHYWTEQQALQARDAAFGAGATAVHVAGRPMCLTGTTSNHPRNCRA